MVGSSWRSHARFSVLVSTLTMAGCGGAPPPLAPTVPLAPVRIAAPAPPPDVSAVPEPEGLLLVGRVRKPEAILKTAGGWARFPLPNAADLVRQATDDSVADAVDFSQPMDGAIALRGAARDPKPLMAFAVGVRSYDDAKAKLGRLHALTAGPNGQLFVGGIGKEASAGAGESEEEHDDDDDAPTCVLAPASSGARLACGTRPALDALVPYLTRTMPRQTWASDVHVEMRLAPARPLVAQARVALPLLLGSLTRSPRAALGALAEAAFGEVTDVVDDTNRVTLDAQIADAGAEATMRIEYGKATSLSARATASAVDRAGPAPAALWHLPAETDTAMFGRGSDPKLFDHVRALLGDALLEGAKGASMPEAERKAVRDLLVDRLFGLITGPIVYGKGYDAAGLERAISALGAVKAQDLAGEDEAHRVVAEQVVGWHLLQVQDPITKVAPIVRDWAQLWNRPAFAKWVKATASSKMLAQVRMAPMPGGVTLPKDAVHLEIVVSRTDLDVPSPLKQNKKIPRKPVVFHVFAVPDQGTTWLGFGLDGKLVAQKAAASLSSASTKNSLGATAMAETLRDGKLNGAWMTTLRGLMVFTAIEGRKHAPFGRLGALANKGETPIVTTFAAQPPSQDAPAGTAVATFKLPRAAIEDVVKLVISSH